MRSEFVCPMCEDFSDPRVQCEIISEVCRPTTSVRAGLQIGKSCACYAIVRGEKTVTIETADKFARALHLSLTELFSELEKEPWTEADERATQVSG